MHNKGAKKVKNIKLKHFKMADEPSEFQLTSIEDINVLAADYTRVTWQMLILLLK